MTVCCALGKWAAAERLSRQTDTVRDGKAFGKKGH